MIITRAMITNVGAILNHFKESDCDTLFAELEPETRSRIGIGGPTEDDLWERIERLRADLNQESLEAAGLKVVVVNQKAVIAKLAEEKREALHDLETLQENLAWANL
jgi:predicted site-specific integrase-resolvase